MATENQPPPKRPSLKLNALSNIGALAVTVAIGLFLTPAMLSYLGEKGFGMWILGSSLVGYFGLLDLGVGSAVFRYVPLFRGQGNHHRVSAVITTSLVFYCALSLTVVLLTQLLGTPIAHYFGGGPDLAKLFRIVGIATAISFPTIVLNTATFSYESFAPANLISASTQVLRAALLVGCMWGRLGVIAMGWALVVVSVASMAGNFFVFKHACKDVHLNPRFVNWADLKILLSFGSVMLIVGMANSLATESPKQIVAKTVSLDALGLFAIPLQLILYYRTLIISMTKVFSPRFSFLAGSENVGEIRRLFVQGCRYTAIIAGGVAILLWVTGPSFLLLWTGKPQIAESIPALMIMVGGTLVFLSHRMGGDLLFGLGHQKQVALLELLEAAGIVGLTIAFSLKWGLLGAALGFAIPPILVRGLLQTLFVCQTLKFGFFQYHTQCVLRTWVVVAILMAVARSLHIHSYVNGWVSLILISGLLLVVYATFTWAFVFQAHEKTQLKLEAGRFLGRLKRLGPASNSIKP